MDRTFFHHQKLVFILCFSLFHAMHLLLQKKKGCENSHPYKLGSLSYDFILYNIIYAAINSWKDDSIVYNLKQTLQLLIKSQVMVNNKRVVVYF